MARETRSNGRRSYYWCNVNALMRHCVDLDEQAVTADLFAVMNGVDRNGQEAGRVGRSRFLTLLAFINLSDIFIGFITDESAMQS